MCGRVALALLSEQLLSDGEETAGQTRTAAKVLLVRSTPELLDAPTRVQLAVAINEQDWRDYEEQRLVVEAGFGVDEPKAREMVSALRARRVRLGLQLYLARDGDRLVGAIARFRLPAHPWCARLQEVDVFPAWRGRGYGDALLAAIFDLLVAEGSSTVVVGADEDDWPLGWYRRRGFRDVARLPSAR